MKDFVIFNKILRRKKSKTPKSGHVDKSHSK